MPKIIHLFRHGQTDWNNQRRLQGHTDIPLNDEGRQQALTLQNYFQENPIDVFMTSDLRRAQETAEIANTHLEKPFLISPDLREVFLGDLEGLTQQEVLEKYGGEAWEQWTSLLPSQADFRYPNAESANQAVARFSQSLTHFCQEYNFTSAGLCTHGFIIRRFLHSLKPEMTEALPIPNCVIYKVEWNEKTGLFYFNS
ncbi:histidine phosphatase family protein [Bdellovibrio sp.]|uniref:histidine phosphatase family protein n=1 Tax=Bdellovibrio sp. TaxID=28201 RepID=UPI0039E30EBC